MSNVPTVMVPIDALGAVTTHAEAIGYRLEHPEGWECDFSEGGCTCGRLEIGIRRSTSPGANDFQIFAEEWLETTEDEA